jgi:hypothetical protein
MPLDLQDFAIKRPKVYHLTSRENVDPLLAGGVLHPAAVLMQRAGLHELIRSKRKGCLSVLVDGIRLWIRDQDPLYEGKMTLEGGWTFGQFIESLNRRVFFWPGDHSGPLQQGLNHFSRYRQEDCAVLVIATSALLASNPGLVPEFCKYNSGSPRCVPALGGRGSPRGPNTFLPPETFSHGWRGVVEVTFPGSVRLPEDGIAIEDHRKWCS